MAWEYEGQCQRVSGNTECEHFRGILQTPSGHAGGLCIRHSAVTFSSVEDTLSVRPSSDLGGPGAHDCPLNLSR